MDRYSDIPLFKVYSAPGAARRLGGVLASGYIGEGPAVRGFEAALKKFWGRGDPVTVSSGTAALDLAYHLAAGAGASLRGVRVLTSPLTCTATNLQLLHRGAAIEWYDCDPLTGSADPADLIRRVNEGGAGGTTVVVLVSWAGGNLEPLLAHLRAGWHHSVTVVLDYAHAAPLPPPLLADYTCYSFQAIKHLTTGDGGALVCASPSDTERARLLRWYGLDRTSSADFRCSQDIADPGFKYHMNDLAASLGSANLATLPQRYDDHNWNGRGLSASLPSWASPFTYTRDSAYWTCPILLSPKILRSHLQLHLTGMGIASGRIHRRNDTHPCFAAFKKEDLPGVTAFDDHHLSIPCGWWLTRTAISRIKKALHSYRPLPKEALP